MHQHDYFTEYLTSFLVVSLLLELVYYL